MRKTVIQFPPKMQAIDQPARYKVLHGGRGGAKSWGVARKLLLRGIEKPLRILCCRELQKSIKDSVHQLLDDQIKRMEMEDFYAVQQAAIKGRNGTEFGFESLRYNATSLKSYEGADVAWVEQAEVVSKSSWEILIPTIRKAGSEIWITMNPELEEDESYQRFVLHPPSDAIVIEMSWRDNPWFPEVLAREKDELLRRDPDAWLNIWEGHCRSSVEGAIYANEIRQATAEDRITKVPYDRSKPVHTAWDLGHSDSTAIWFFQQVGFEYRFLKFIQDTQHHLPHYLKLLQDQPYVYGTDYLPHDAGNATLASQSIADLMREAGRKVEVVARTENVNLDLNIVRTAFDSYWFDAEGCADGLQALRHYRYRVEESTGQRSREPLHDWASHGADALRTFALGYRRGTVRRAAAAAPRPRPLGDNPSHLWMGI